MRRRRTTPREYALPTDIDDGAAHFDERWPPPPSGLSSREAERSSKGLVWGTEGERSTTRTPPPVDAPYQAPFPSGDQTGQYR
jgi:hypothetical protein